MPFERLPYTVRPEHYEIKITTNFETFEFEGETTINADVLEATKLIKLNSAELRKPEVDFFIKVGQRPI